MTTPTQLLQQASQPTLEQIARDKDRAGQKVRELLECLEANLFHPTCNVNFLKFSTGNRDNSVTLTFHSQMGTTPRRYIENRRMETGMRLLAHRSLKVLQVAELVGYSSVGVFGKAFMRWCGLRPAAFRDLLEDSRQRESLLLQPRSGLTTEDLHLGLKGELGQSEGWQLLTYLQALYPEDQVPPGAT